MASCLIRAVPRLSRSTISSAPAHVRRYATPAIPEGLKINGQRLWDNIHHSCQWGTGKRWGDAPYETGMSRLALSDSDKEARDWFCETTRSLGCKVTVDAIGNIFAIKPGQHPGPATCAGSHLDTQPTGGRYDGILGVCAGIEMLRTLRDNNINTSYPIGVINWTNEEGARFPMSMMASGVWAGAIKLKDAYQLKEVGDGGRTVKDELARIGYLGEMLANHRDNPIAAHFELHIEQGPRLENAGNKIGIVSGVQSYEWLEVTVTGRDCHTGTTPMNARADALLAAAEMIQASNKIARESGALASTGIIRALPGSVNTVPGLVTFSLDIRASSDKERMHVAKGIERSWARQFEQRDKSGLRYEIEKTFDSKAVNFDEHCIGMVRESAKSNFGHQHAALQSGAGHDSVFTSKAGVPTTMIFVPCRKGVSHHPEEFCSQQDCANGAQVLAESVLRYDQHRVAQNV